MQSEAEVTVESLALGERKFLHDISNQLVVAQGMGSIVLKNMKKVEDDLDPKLLERMEKTVKAVDKMIAMIKERRSLLHSVSTD